MNASSDESQLTYSIGASTVLCLIFGIIAMLTVLGNVSVFVAYGRDQTLRTKGNCYILSLALANLIMGAVIMPLTMVQELWNNYFWMEGTLVCKIYQTLSYSACTLSPLSVVLITIDRYKAITKPFNKLIEPEKRTAISVVIVCWLLTLGYATPMVWIKGSNSNATEKPCCFCGLWEKEKILPIYYSIDQFEPICCLFIILVLNALIFADLRQRSRRFYSNGDANVEAVTNFVSAKLELHRDRRNAKFLATLTGFAALLWIPCASLCVMATMCPSIINSNHAIFVTSWIMYCDATINPFLYPMVNPQWMYQFVRMWHMDKFLNWLHQHNIHVYRDALKLVNASKQTRS